jgi:hypothetical protein
VNKCKKDNILKEKFTMKLKNNFLFVCLLTIFALIISTPQAIAGGGIEPPPEGAIFEGPEIWGVVVMYCGDGSDIATVRFKRVVDCNVETQALVDTLWLLECPPDAAGATGHTLPEGTTVFGKSTPYITKVKNFKIEGDIVSFDAQFKYWHR